MESKKLKLTFATGVTTVTGANFLLETVPPEETVRILVDCGMEQGSIEAEKNNRMPFAYDPTTIDYLLVTHAHIDHIGRIPKLVKDGFKGKIFSTPETKALAPLLLEDSAHLLEGEAERSGLPVLYNMNDVKKAFTLWHEIPYHTPTKLHGGFDIYIKDAGHILGSGMYEITYNGKKILFSGDLGNSPTPLLEDTEQITGETYVVMESVYGDRNHESHAERRDKLENVIEDTIRDGGALVIPCFSLEKTQVILHEINNLVEEGRVPSVPVFLDSPLAIKVTEVYRRFQKNFNNEVKTEIKEGDDIFNFKKLRLIQSSEESKQLLDIPNPKIIIAGSGMSNGGRVVHHELNYLPDPKSTILLIGYQSHGTLGRRIQEKPKSVRILGQEVLVRANIVQIDGYSSHKDSDHLVSFVADTRDTVKKVFPVMGEPKSSIFLAQKIQDNLGVEVYHPADGESVLLDF
jgi:metallo-beta-lactamase family protein